MITLASVGDLPALPLGMSYPKRKNWLLGKPGKTKKLKLGLRKESMNFIIIPRISQFFEAVDPKLRASRIIKVWDKAKKYAGQANRFYTKSIGYRKDYSDILPTGSPATKKMNIRRGNRAAAYELHKYAQAKSDKALYISRKFANKVAKAKPAKVAKPEIGGTGQIAAYVFKTRRNRD